MKKSGFRDRRGSLLRALAGLVLSSLFFASCSPKEDEPPEQTLLQKLQALPGFQVTPIQTLQGFAQSFQIDFTQPVDHAAPAAGTFAQRFYLSSRSDSAPMVFYTSGYGISRNFEPELSALLQANQILLVHRFFPDAVLPDWRYLTIRQAAGDQHRIREALGKLFPGKWVSTGASKGGMTALFYRRYYPGDVDATVAFVAPLMPSPDDPRFASFLSHVGKADCRQKLRDFQRLVLSRRASLLELFKQYNQGQNYAFSIISEEAAFEYSVLEYPFAFWQYGAESDCAGIPGTGASDQQLLDHLVDVSSPYYYSDQGFLYFQPLFYQAYTEIGYCPYIYNHLQGFLQVVLQPDYRAFAPRGVDLVFRPEVMQDVIPWLQNQGQRIIYIYGGIDPWTAAAAQPVGGLDVVKVVQPGGNHSLKIGDLDQKELVIQTLEEWLNIQIDRSLLAAWEAPPEKVRL
jgi:PS-10 peptidase S37